MKRVWVVFILFVLATFYYLLFYSRRYPQRIEVIPASSNLSLYVMPDDGREVLIQSIRDARSEILMEIYLLSDRSVIDEIEKAHERGVAVNIIIECNPFGGEKINKKTRDELNRKKINNKCASDRFWLTHEKAIIIDGKQAFIMTQNLTAASFDKNREYDILDTNYEDVGEIKNIFMADWKEDDFVPSSNNIIESPNNARAGLTALIDSAEDEIDIEMEVIDDTQIMNLLNEKAKKVKVKVILPTVKQVGANKKMIDDLRGGGVEVRTMGSPYVHAKMILVDRSKAYVGSVNLTSASIDENRELGIILSQGDVVNRLYEVFRGDWEKGLDIL